MNKSQNRMLMSKSFALSVLAAALLLAGCSTQEPFQRPKLDIPDQFKEATSQGAEAGIWQPARNGLGDDAKAQVPAEWWKLYGDAKLDELQAEAQLGNQSIAQSVARVRSAQAAVSSASKGSSSSHSARGASASGLSASLRR